MTTPINWPTTLPDKADTQGYNWSWGDTTLRTEMEEGPKKVRKLQTSSPDTHSVTMLISVDQIITLKNYYEVTLQGGSLPFTFTHPVTQVLTVFRFMGSPSFSPVGGINFSASMAWEELYEAT